MPIAFPTPSQDNLFTQQAWLKLATKAFNVVQFTSIGIPSKVIGATLDPLLSLRTHPNLQTLGKNYVDVSQTSIVNPNENFTRSTVVKLRNLGETNRRIIGVSRNATGTALGACQIKIFRTADDVLVATTVSDGAGNWIAYPNQTGPYYFVMYKSGSPDVFGTSPNTNTATPFTAGG